MLLPRLHAEDPKSRGADALVLSMPIDKDLSVAIPANAQEVAIDDTDAGTYTDVSFVS